MNAPVPIAFQNERLLQRMKADPALWGALREMFLRRREERRLQVESMATGNVDVMRGRAQELTSILNEIFTEE